MDVPLGYCQCGCGLRTRIATKTDSRNGAMKGQPRMYVKGHARAGRTKERYVVDPETGCWIWQLWKNPQGYGYMQQRNPRRTILAHRWMFQQVKGWLPEGPLDHACHTADQDCPGGRECRHRACINPDHLVPVTALQNVHNGRNCKMSAKDVEEARRMRAAGAIYREIAERFDVTIPTVIRRLK